MGMDTGAVLYKLAAEFKLARNTMENRLRLQKTVYLLQDFGLHLGYGFSWYRYGPYSQELVYDAYRSLHVESQKYAKEAKSLTFSANTEDWLRRFKETLGGALSDAKQMELLASVSFVRKAWHPAPTEFVQSFKRHKKSFFDGTPIDDNAIQAAAQKLDELGTALAT